MSHLFWKGQTIKTPVPKLQKMTWWGKEIVKLTEKKTMMSICLNLVLLLSLFSSQLSPNPHRLQTRTGCGTGNADFCIGHWRLCVALCVCRNMRTEEIKLPKMKITPLINSKFTKGSRNGVYIKKILAGCFIWPVTELMEPTLAATLTDNSLLYYINTVLPYSCHIVQTVVPKSVTLTKKLKAQLKYKHSILKTKKKIFIYV